jgi:hypothetical protein
LHQTADAVVNGNEVLPTSVGNNWSRAIGGRAGAGTDIESVCGRGKLINVNVDGVLLAAVATAFNDDSSANGNPGTLIGFTDLSACRVTGLTNGALNFNGDASTADLVAIPNVGTPAPPVLDDGIGAQFSKLSAKNPRCRRCAK